MTTDPTARGDTPMMTEAEIRARDAVEAGIAALSAPDVGGSHASVARGLLEVAMWGLAERDDLRARLAEAQAEIARLREALRPFAQAHAWGPDDRFKIVLAGPEGDITGVDLDRARADLSPAGEAGQ